MPELYKTPGVYIEEIPKFPPSIAPVETAIPAFIGYTEKAVRNGEFLFNKPTRIESIAEYELLFGGAPSQDVSLFLDTNNQLVRAEANAHLYLYDSLRLFYANGGGVCYIVSIDAYPANVDASKLKSAISLLEQEDEPTILIAPDAVSDSTNLYEFQKEALTQCNKLKDRVAICDLKAATGNTPDDFRDSVNDFKDKIGINYLKYGIAYGPWLRANLPRTLLRRNVILKRYPGGDAVQLKSLTNDADIKNLIDDLLSAEGLVDASVTAKKALTGTPLETLDDALAALRDTYMATVSSATEADIENAIKPLGDYMISIIDNIKANYDKAPDPATSRSKLKTDIDKYIASSNIKMSLRSVADHHKYLSTLAKPINLLTTGAALDSAAAFLGFTDGATLLTPDVPAGVAAAYSSATKAKQRGDVAINVVFAGAKEAVTFFTYLETCQNTYEKTINDALLAAFGAYKDLVTKAADALNLLPPSGAIAGVYAAVDRDRGVWKAPANVSLNAVVGPVVKITQEQQADYNVDINAGKSINIIRAFNGKGTLVWGARTLAGNDNEWRYVNVRRFFNFVEESTKKATEQFVFEPNDANTWVRVQAMIENFLTVLWRQGALQGVKPEHAFYVAVGLGKTMTAQDILEGRMIVEIGMAAVRPAEFIILRFSHKMAES
ncbi:MAG TPA: phage tail sheath C-terminal domain-containing protein [Geobacteraceae bacterium]